VRPRFIAPGDDAWANREELIAALGRFDATIQTVLRQLPSIIGSAAKTSLEMERHPDKLLDFLNRQFPLTYATLRAAA
jgi:hypothetical protein